MKKEWIALLTTIFLIAVVYVWHMQFGMHRNERTELKVGFVYIGDESNPYTQNFIMAQHAIEKKYGSQVVVEVRNNVSEGKEEAVLRELAEVGCDLVFATSYGYNIMTKEIATEYPDIQFCLATGDNAIQDPVENYHTFLGYAYECRYVAGVVAGMKLQELVDQGEIIPSEAKVGYVAAYPYAEVISGYTAFLMGVRSVCPEAKMLVKYVDSWSSYKRERDSAKELLDLGCIVISQHSDTIGPAVACEAYSGRHPAYHVGFSQNMIEVAPTTSLVSCRINWEPYMVSAVDAVLHEKRIEDVVQGVVNGNDVGAGFERGWVEMLELNKSIAAPRTQAVMEQAIAGLQKGEIQVFQGDYTGVNPFDDKDRIDLRTGYQENAHMSYPSFSYVLEDVIQIVN